MSEKITSFGDVCAINVNDKAEKKNGLAYLSWAWAWAEFVKVYPNATYEIIKNTNGMPYFKDECGAFVYTKVDNGSLIHEMWLPVMDNRNQAIKSPDSMAINKTVMRCLTKNLAMFGLGLYIYAGEDLPEVEEQNEKQKEDDKMEKYKELVAKTMKHFKMPQKDAQNILNAGGVKFELNSIQSSLNDFDGLIAHLERMQRGEA